MAVRKKCHDPSHQLTLKQILSTITWFYGNFRFLAHDLGMAQNLRRFLKDESGATAIEYGLIAAGVALAIITAVKGVGTKLNTTFSSISSQLN